MYIAGSWEILFRIGNILEGSLIFFIYIFEPFIKNKRLLVRLFKEIYPIQ